MMALAQALGEQDVLQSHGAELCGHFFIVSSIEILQEWANTLEMDVSNRGAEIGCDNESSLRTCDFGHSFNPSQRDCDLVSSLHNRVSVTEGSLKDHWVKGHQDKIQRLQDLDWWGQMNVRCDSLAKAFLHKIAAGHLKLGSSI